MTSASDFPLEREEFVTALGNLEKRRNLLEAFAGFAALGSPILVWDQMLIALDVAPDAEAIAGLAAYVGEFLLDVHGMELLESIRGQERNEKFRRMLRGVITSSTPEDVSKLLDSIRRGE